MWLYCAAAIFLAMVGFYAYLLLTHGYEPEERFDRPVTEAMPGPFVFSDPFGPAPAPGEAPQAEITSESEPVLPER